MKTGKLKHRKIKLVNKNPFGPGTDVLYYAEAGERVSWEGKVGSAEYYGREILWCKLWSGESIGLEPEEVKWDEDTNQH